ncbi:NAD(P)/FAD-dependent oxidoreductase [Luteimicrobium sp. DT211]|uniref:NAD(P)/FAD-dependent oxidoreductase n=1 Tax=Luteimicrobium sp. DT211 TaxID=3393412 RepID=UPI003CF59FD9
MRVLVLGAGVAGASVAWSLARRGAEVVVVDRLHDGAATLAGAGIVRASLGITEPGFVEAYAAAVRHYPRAMRDLAADLGRDAADEVGYRVVGGLWLSRDDAALAGVEARLRAFGPEQVGTVSRLDPAQAREAFPAAAPDLAAVHVTRAARVDGRRLRLALLAAARAHGATVHDDDARLSPDRTAAELASGDRLEADHVVVAAGTWTPAVLAPRGLGVPITPQRGQISHLGLPGTDTSHWAVATAIGSSHYLLAFDDSRVVTGYGASGLTLGPYLGERVADDVLGLPSADDAAGLAALDPARFGAGAR